MVMREELAEGKTLFGTFDMMTSKKGAGCDVKEIEGGGPRKVTHREWERKK